MMRMMFHQYSKGRVLFTSSPSARVRVVQEDLPEWSLTRTTTMMAMMCSRRLWARWRILGEGQMLESNERLFLLTVKILIRVQERNSSCLNIFLCLTRIDLNRTHFTKSEHIIVQTKITLSLKLTKLSFQIKSPLLKVSNWKIISSFSALLSFNDVPKCSLIIQCSFWLVRFYDKTEWKYCTSAPL